MIGQSAAKSYAYLVGVYLGDGCVCEDKNGYLAYRQNTIDRDFAEAVRATLLDLGVRSVSLTTHAVKKSSKPNHSIAAQSGARDLCERLVRDTDAKRHLPADVFDWPRDHKLALIGGLMDSEGFVGANRNPTNRRYHMGFKSCDVWVPDFVRLLASVGIRVGKVSQEAPARPGYKTPTRFTIKMQSWIDSGARFVIGRKQARVEAWASAGAYERRARHPRRLRSETTRQTGGLCAAA